MAVTTPLNKSTIVNNLMVGVVGSNCVVIAVEKLNADQNSICSLNGKITVAWSGHSPDSQTIVDKAKLYTNSVHGLNSPANRVAEFLIDPEIRMLNNLPTLPYAESFMVASSDNQGGRYLYVTDTYGTISHVLASAVGRKSDTITNVLQENYLAADKGILGTIDFALKTMCVVVEPDSKSIEVSVTAFNRPFECQPSTERGVEYTFLFAYIHLIDQCRMVSNKLSNNVASLTGKRRVIKLNV